MSRLSEGFLTLSSLCAFSILVTSSAAAARVNVTTSSRETSAAPEHTRSVMRLVRTEVFPLPAAALGAVVFTALMYREVTHCFNTNMVFTAAPAAVCLVELSAALKLKARRLYPRLRAMSEWIYLSHFYFFYFFSWTVKWNPLPLTERNIALSVFVPMLLFAWVMARLAEKEKFAWVKKLI